MGLLVNMALESLIRAINWNQEELQVAYRPNNGTLSQNTEQCVKNPDSRSKTAEHRRRKLNGALRPAETTMEEPTDAW